MEPALPYDKREPLVIRAALVAAVTALIHVLVVTGVLHIDPDAEDAIAGLVDLVGTAVVVIWGRSKVTPVADPAQEVKDAAVSEVLDYEPKHSADPSV